MSTKAIRSLSSSPIKRPSRSNRPADGILAGVTAKADDVIPVTEVIAYILAPGEALPAKAAPQPVAAAAAPSTAKVATAVEPAAAVAEAAEPGKVRATPVARRLAQELGVDLTQITGRGPRGRIHKADVLAFQKSQPSVERSERSSGCSRLPTMSAPRTIPASVSLSAPIPLPDARRKQVIPLAGPRKIICRTDGLQRLHRSAH